MDDGVWNSGRTCLAIVKAMGREPRSEGGVGGRGVFHFRPADALQESRWLFVACF